RTITTAVTIRAELLLRTITTAVTIRAELQLRTITTVEVQQLLRTITIQEVVLRTQVAQITIKEDREIDKTFTLLIKIFLKTTEKI
ncbi:MAG: hypothetical protein JXR68_11770, partial [Bacteroidales bacterium]|nr:hypothetical protein [Bacteroidales bacterium]